MGERVVQKDLAATLREIGKNGSAAFYSGPIAQKFAAYMKSVGGLIDEKDLAVVQGRSKTRRFTSTTRASRSTNARRTRRAT